MGPPRTHADTDTSTNKIREGWVRQPGLQAPLIPHPVPSRASEPHPTTKLMFVLARYLGERPKINSDLSLGGVRKPGTGLGRG